MNKVEPLDVAKWFIKEVSPENSMSGNIKLQKLLFFSQLIYMAKNNNKTMYDDKFCAFEHGMVLEKVRLEYKDNYFNLKESAFKELYIPEDIEEALILTKEIFGECSSEELSELTHEFDVWNKYLKKSINPLKKWHNKKMSAIPYDELETETYRINKVLDAYETTSRFTEDEEEDY